MQIRLPQTKTWPEIGLFIARALMGCALISVCSFIKIPGYPVPFTMQTFAIFFLALTQSPKQAFASTICFLLSASSGLPIFGHANALWFIGRSAGYLVAFPIAAFVTSWLAEKTNAFWATLCGLAIIYAFGFAWLATFLGMKLAFIKGVWLFIPSGLAKNFAAIGASRLWNRFI